MSQNEINLLHENIKHGHLDEVRNFLERNTNDNTLCNANCESAAATARKYDQLEIYELLISKGVCLGLHEVDWPDGEPPEKKLKLQTIHNTYTIKAKPSHLVVLNDKSRLSHNTNDDERAEGLKYIEKAFEDRVD